MISVILSTSVIKDFNLNNASKFKKNVGVAAAITAKARVKLYNAQEDVINNGGRLLYSDTDSIFAAYKTNVLDEKHGIIH
jgi:DNA polymerase elongation subunit (family B)